MVLFLINIIQYDSIWYTTTFYFLVYLCNLYLCNLYMTIKSIPFSLFSPQPPSSSLSPSLICLLWRNDGRLNNHKHRPHPRGQYHGLRARLGLAEGLSLLVHAGLASIGNIIFVMHIQILNTIVLDL